MATVFCSVREVDLENDNGYLVEGTEVTCNRCGHVTESYGTSESSVKRCLAIMREECPRGEDGNFYIQER